MLIQFIKPDFVFADDRGSLNQLVNKGWNQVNVITSKAGNIRGGHFHKKNVEAFYVISGSFRLEVSKEDVIEEYHLKEGDMFKIAPFVIHTFFYNQDTILVSLYDKGVEEADGTKDIFQK